MQHHAFSEAARSFANGATETILTLLLILVLSVQVCASATGGQNSNDPNLIVMTFNIRYGSADDKQDSWPNRREMVYDVLRRHDPDVVGLQEALRFQIDEIRAALPQYGEIGVGREDGKTEGEYSAILYRKDHLALDDSGTFWLSDTPEVPGSISWNSACRRVCTWGRFLPKGSDAASEKGESGLYSSTKSLGSISLKNGQDEALVARAGFGREEPKREVLPSQSRPDSPFSAFYLFNTHLDHKSQPARQNGAILLSRRIAERKHADPVILTGDFNAAEDNPAIQYLKGLSELASPDGDLFKNPTPLVDSFRVAHPNEQVAGTFHGFQGGVNGGKIDYIFIQPDVVVKAAQILHDNKDGRYPSDHFPVLAVLRFVGRAGQ
ncbi:MAG: endonuclease/exonuclease/phosphatase family protein [Phycisphaerales bacterium]